MDCFLTSLKVKARVPRRSLEAVILLALGITKLYCFTARVQSSIVCSIVFLSQSCEAFLELCGAAKATRRKLLPENCDLLCLVPTSDVIGSGVGVGVGSRSRRSRSRSRKRNEPYFLVINQKNESQSESEHRRNRNRRDQKVSFFLPTSLLLPSLTFPLTSF